MNTFMVTSELVICFIGAVAIIAGIMVLREVAQHDRKQRERDGMPQRPPFLTRVRRRFGGERRD